MDTADLIAAAQRLARPCILLKHTWTQRIVSLAFGVALLLLRAPEGPFVIG